MASLGRPILPRTFAKVPRRRRPEGAAEHAGEGTRTLIAKVERDGSDWLASREPVERRHQPGLLAPGTEAHACLRTEQSCEGSRRRAGQASPLRQRARLGGIA